METLPHLDECRAIISTVIKQAVVDYFNYLAGSNVTEFDFLTAQALLFDDDYMLFWGDCELTGSQFCELVDLDLLATRDGLNRRVNCQKQEKVVGLKPTQGERSFP